MQWAQNSSAVFLAVKYATRWSAPGAIEVVDIKVNISSCCFELEGFGHHSNIRKRYVADLPLYADLLPNLSTWSAASVGRLTATLQKAQDSKWPRLTKGKGKDASKHQIGKWLDMQERWDESLKDLPSEKKDKKSKSADKDSNKTATPNKKRERIKTGGLTKFWRLLRGTVRNIYKEQVREVKRWWKKPEKYRVKLVALGCFLFLSALLLLGLIVWGCYTICYTLARPFLTIYEARKADRTGRRSHPSAAHAQKCSGCNVCDGAGPDPDESDGSKQHEKAEEPVAPDPDAEQHEKKEEPVTPDPDAE